jgi:hypothetical protein
LRPSLSRQRRSLNSFTHQCCRLLYRLASRLLRAPLIKGWLEKSSHTDPDITASSLWMNPRGPRPSLCRPTNGTRTCRRLYSRIPHRSAGSMAELSGLYRETRTVGEDSVGSGQSPLPVRSTGKGVGHVKSVPLAGQVNEGGVGQVNQFLRLGPHSPEAVSAGIGGQLLPARWPVRHNFPPRSGIREGQLSKQGFQAPNHPTGSNS